MLKLIVKLGIVALILNALFRFGAAYIRYVEFKDAVQEMALYSKEKDDSAVVDRVLELAGKNGVPLEREYVQVRRDAEHTYVDASYVEMIKWAPGYAKPWQFDVGAAAWHVRPPTVSDLR